jgi:hypothetical protein
MLGWFLQILYFLTTIARSNLWEKLKNSRLMTWAAVFQLCLKYFNIGRMVQYNFINDIVS